ncbi:hypothetical protein [Paenibacillus sp. 1P03SA]|uniref:hypothetical protein n=1 Tax=Paenibacillus sp. 1P03SA TaxID=3132294 RepID=UPI0039A3688E
MKILADKSKCLTCGIVIFLDKANDYCPKCDKSTEWYDLDTNVEIDEKLLGIRI